MAQLKLYRGATYNEPLALNMDITGATVYVTAKPDFDSDTTDAAAVIKKDITAHTTPASGLTTLNLTSTDTDKPPGEYIIDVHVKKADGTVIPFKPETLVILDVVTLRS